MIAVYLTPSEKDTLAHWLSARARTSGWFLIGLGGFMLLLILFVILRRGFVPAIFDTPEEVVAIFMPILVLVGAGIWLLRRKRVIRGWLDEPLHSVHGRILDKQQTAYSGHRIRLQVPTDLGTEMVANLGYIGTPDWQVGNELELLLWTNGRFCPRHITHLVDVAYLPTPERRRLIRNRIIKVVVWYLILTGIGILMALYGQGRL